MFKIGEINNLVVKEKVYNGYVLEDDLFLQTSESLTVGDKVDVFVFLDSKKKPLATLNKPIIRINHPGFIKVKEVVPSLGVFLDNNTSKDLLISKDDLPDFSKWPVAGDTVFCKVKLTKTQLIAKLVTPEEVKSIFEPVIKLEKFGKVDAIVIKSGLEGINLLTENGHSIFVYYKHRRKDYRVGERVNVTINNVRDDIYNGTLLDSKVPLMRQDADIIMDYLRDNDGFMPLTAKSDVSEIEKLFNMSKSAFKRALGNLYKKRLIDFDEKGTHLKTTD